MNRAIIAVLLIAPVVYAASTPIPLSFHELVEHPKKYNGKHVSVRAYLVTSCVHCGEFFADVNCARHHRDKHSVAIGRFARASLMDVWPRSRLASAQPKVPNDGFVFVTGTFRWNDPKAPLPKDSENVRWVRNGGFGWMGNDYMTITDITEYRPVGGNVPAGIN